MKIWEEKFIYPNKPVKLCGFFEYTIKLKEKEVDCKILQKIKDIKKFKKQNFLHITIIGDKASERIEKALKKLTKKEQEKRVKQIKSTIKKLKWQYSQKAIYLINKHSLIGDKKIKEHRESYIALVEMPDMKILFREINKILKTSIPAQFPHITLFTRGEHKSRIYKGISVSSKSVFKKLNPKKVN
jgi:hypothetical protein